jgi:hypothetical protein
MYVTAVAAGQIQRLCAGVRLFTWYYLSPTRRDLGFLCVLELGGYLE